MDIQQMNKDAQKVACEIKSRFGFSDEDCAKWAKFVVMTAECVSYYGADHAETIIESTARHYLK